MSAESVTFTGGLIFDGQQLHQGKSAVFRDGVLSAISSDSNLPDGSLIDLGGAVLSHGYVDLQVNGGDGVMFNDSTSVEGLSRIATAHRRLGTTHLLPTLITDTRERTASAIRAANEAVKRGVSGITGLHLEGPHLSVERKGAHDPDLIRPMEDDDLKILLAAKVDLPVLKVTIAPESVSLAQVSALSEAGILVSLGHTDADYDTCIRYVEAGARCATHLFNAMSQLGNRNPGLVGAALDCEGLSAGLIADGIHVHPAAMRAAWKSKRGPGQVFLVSDAMAVAGTNSAEFELGGRRIVRSDGRLTLEDGTLAGADLDLTTAVKILVEKVGVPLHDALQAATYTPAKLIGRDGSLIPGKTRLNHVIKIESDLSRSEPVLS